MSHTGEQQFEIVVNLGGCADGRARVFGRNLLFNGDCGSDARDQIDVGFFDTTEELTRISRQTFDITALTLGKNCVEGQRGLTRPRESGNDH